MGQEMSLGHPHPYHRLRRCRRIRLGGNEKLMNPLHTHSLGLDFLFLSRIPQNFTRSLYHAAPTFRVATFQSAPRLIGGQFTFTGTFRFFDSWKLSSFVPLRLAYFHALMYYARNAPPRGLYLYLLRLPISTRLFWNVLFGLIVRTSYKLHAHRARSLNSKSAATG